MMAPGAHGARALAQSGGAVASCAARSRAGHYAAQLAAQGHAHSVPLRQSSDVADIALGHVRPPCPRHGHLTSGRPSAAQAPQQHAHQQHRAHINTNSAPRRLCAYHAAQHQHTRGLLRPTSGPIAHASPSTAPSLPRAGHLEALRRPYTSMTSAAAPAVAVVCGSTEPHPHPHPHPRFALHGDTGAPLGGGERLASSLTETTTGRSGSVSLPIEARAGEGGDRSAATAAVTLAQQESLSSTSATAEPQESTCVRPAFSSAHNMDMHGASSDGSVGEGWSAAAHHDPLPAEDDAVHPLGIQSPAVAPGVRDWGEFHRRQVSVREFREKGRKAVGNSGFDKKAVHEALRSCATLAETTPRQRARHASWLMQRVVSKGWDPTLAHFNAFLNVLEHNPPRSFSLGKILRVMDRHGAVPDKHTWDSLIRIALSVGGVDAALWVLYAIKARTRAPNFLGTFLEPVAAAHFQQDPSAATPQDLVLQLTERRALCGYLNPAAWLALLRAAAGVRGLSGGMEVVELMRHQGRTVTPQHLSVVLQGGLQNAADSHAVDAVVARFASVHHLLPTSADVTVMIRIFARGGKHALAEQHISALRARGIEPEPLAWSLLVSAYGNGNEPVLGLERLRSLLGEGVPVSVRERVFVPLLLAHARQGRVDAGLDTMATMKGEFGVKPGVLSKNALLTAHSARGDLKKCLELMEELEKSRKGGAVTAHTYAYVAAAAAYNGDDALVHHLVAERMKARHLQPDAAVFTHVLQGYARARRADSLFSVMELMTAEGVPMDTQVGVALLNVLGSDLDAALDVFELLPKLGVPHSVHTFASIMRAACAQEPALAIRLFDMMRAEGIAPTAAVYSFAIQAHLALKDLPSAQRAFTSMLEKGACAVTPSVYARLLPAYVRSGDVGAVRSLLEDMESRGLAVDSRMRERLLWAYAYKGDISGALSVLPHLDESATREPRVWNALLHARAANGDVEGVRDVVAQMRDRGLSGTWATVRGVAVAVRCCAHILPVSEALSLLSNAMATIKDSESSGGSGSNIEAETTAAALMRLRALNAIMASYARRGAVAETDELLATMQAEGTAPDSSTYAHMMKARVVAGDVGDAVSLAERVLRGECGAGVHADAGFVQAAVESLCGVGEANEAARLLRLHFEHAGVPGAVPVPAFEVVVRGLGEQGSLTAALDLLPHIRSAIAYGNRHHYQLRTACRLRKKHSSSALSSASSSADNVAHQAHADPSRSQPGTDPLGVGVGAKQSAEAAAAAVERDDRLDKGDEGEEEEEEEDVRFGASALDGHAETGMDPESLLLQDGDDGDDADLQFARWFVSGVARSECSPAPSEARQPKHVSPHKGACESNASVEEINSGVAAEKAGVPQPVSGALVEEDHAGAPAHKAAMPQAMSVALSIFDAISEREHGTDGLDPRVPSVAEQVFREYIRGGRRDLVQAALGAIREAILELDSEGAARTNVSSLEGRERGRASRHEAAAVYADILARGQQALRRRARE